MLPTSSLHLALCLCTWLMMSVPCASVAAHGQASVAPTAGPLHLSGGRVDAFAYGINPTLPFASFKPSLTIATTPINSNFSFSSTLTLSANGAAFDPTADVVTLQIGTVSMSILSRSFKSSGSDAFSFKGRIGSVDVSASIQPEGDGKYQVEIDGSGTDLADINNPINVVLKIGSNVDAKQVTASISGPRTRYGTSPQSEQDVLINPFGRNKDSKDKK
jgi:hypothetical protein